ncbi:MAG: hypothetical protein ABIS86_09855 [Streptosporangiaceae bacterium]
MPCFNCGSRQSDPVRGASPWIRGVRADRQVLVCPGCGLQAELSLDRCAECASAELVCRLGEVECRACGHTREACPAGQAGPDAPGPSEAPGLADEVAQALNRVLEGVLPRRR